ncbi:MAG: ABC transporter ATP-binding protein [Proteobacteria bacterium]|nr:ABC transporter ATP-binding protein [Pseudomonadota bacterium]
MSKPTSPESASVMLQVRGLARSFGGVRAVRGIDLLVRAGEAVALIGANGAGKTTTFNLINGQLRPDAGTIHLAGHAIGGRSPEELFRIGVARTFQITATFSSMTVRENVQMALLSHDRAFAPSWRALARRADRAGAERAMALLAEQGLDAQAHRAANELAYGDLKRLELAMALASEPRLLLMDEPTAGMAPTEREPLMRSALAACRVRGAALLFTEHDMDIVFNFADRVIVLDRGSVIAEGRPEDIRRHDDVRAVYLGERGAFLGDKRAGANDVDA